MLGLCDPSNLRFEYSFYPPRSDAFFSNYFEDLLPHSNSIAWDRLCKLSLRNPRDVMLPAAACTVCKIFAFELILKLALGSLEVIENATVR